MQTQPIYVGIDVSKGRLDVARHDEDDVWRVGNDVKASTSSLLGSRRSAPNS